MKKADRNSVTRVAIGIQARSGSTRLPSKITRPLCGKPMLEWVIDACISSAAYLSRPNLSRNIKVSVALLIPKDDPVKSLFYNKVQIIEGSENDVLSRYISCGDFFDADYVVRVTGDCALITSGIITKCINSATMEGLDYVSNVDERLRLSFDGLDCEVISRRLLSYVGEHATDSKDREHVTTFIRSGSLPNEFTMGDVIPYCDLSSMKLSIDNEDDFVRVEKHLSRVLEAIETSKKLGHKVYRF